MGWCRMSSLEELKDALRDTLAARGSLGQIQARVRAEIFNALEETVRRCSLSLWVMFLRLEPRAVRRAAPRCLLATRCKLETSTRLHLLY